MPEYKNYSNGTLMATDALGRKVADLNNARGQRADRLVGMFYFLWHGEHGRHKPYDITKILSSDPNAAKDPNSTSWGDVGVYHHWGEPFYGYYFSDDEWVIRKHMKLLIEADIDFLFLDVTNAETYDSNVKILMRVLDEYSRDGWKIPRVMFYTNTESGKTVEHLYRTVYLERYCPDTWFCLDGRPVIVAVEEECSAEARAFFNIKRSQWPNEPDKVGGWPWMDFIRPQRVFFDECGNAETMSVSVAQHPQERFGDSVLYGETRNRGRSFHDGANDVSVDAYKYGYNFAEQFDRAIEADVTIVLVTGWNEWIAGRWRGPADRPIKFVDAASAEYSRDLEMMKGGYFDNYYMLLVDRVRKYKGVTDYKMPVAHGDTVTYEHFSDGDFERCAEGYGAYYVNRSQRNAIKEIGLRVDGDELEFVIKTKKKITADRSGTWMKVYLNTSGGEGYDFLLNNTPQDNGTTTLARITGNGLDCTDVAEAHYFVEGDKLTLRVALGELKLDKHSTLWFKVADSRENIQAIEDFYSLGDVAPLGRLNYVYKWI